MIEIIIFIWVTFCISLQGYAHASDNGLLSLVALFGFVSIFIINYLRGTIALETPFTFGVLIIVMIYYGFFYMIGYTIGKKL